MGPPGAGSVGARAAGPVLSAVDVPGAVSVVVWLCGCNLRCPFCHNWRLLDASACGEVPLERLEEEVRGAARLADYLVLTGGEPLLQPEACRALLRLARGLGLRTCVNTNLTLGPVLARLISEGLVDRVAADVKPFLLMEVPERSWPAGVREIEIRIPVPRHEDCALAQAEAARSLAEKYVERGAETWVVAFPIRGGDCLDPDWCGRYADPPEELVGRVASEAGVRGARVRVLGP